MARKKSDPLWPKVLAFLKANPVGPNEYSYKIVGDHLGEFWRGIASSCAALGRRGYHVECGMVGPHKP